MTVLAKKKKKTKKPAILNLGRRFKGPAQLVHVEDDSSEEDDNNDEDVKEKRIMRILLKTKTSLMNNILLQMIDISSWRTGSRKWKFRRCLDWILVN